jgi:hypothetical protein
VADLTNVLQSTDGGIGSPAELTPVQLTLALTAASNRVSVYFGTIMDGSNPQAVAPDIFQSLTLDLASFYAWRTYLKGRAVPVDHPAYIAYKDALSVLQDARNGKIRLDPAVAGGIDQEIGKVINRIPRIFNGNDSNTRIDPLTGDLESDVPTGTNWAPRGGDFLGGTVYQG